MIDIMLDLETLGRRPGCRVLSIGAVVFSPTGLAEEFYCALKTDEQTTLHEDLETVRWWQQQSPEARSVLTEPKEDFVTGMAKFSAWVQRQGGKRSVSIWGNGSDFDNAIIQLAFDAAEISPPWEYWNNRCYRTLKNLPGVPKAAKFVGTKHNALADARNQALHAIDVMKHLKVWW